MSRTEGPAALMAELLLDGGQLLASDGKLTCRGPRDVLDKPRAEALSEYKRELLAAVGDQGKRAVASFAQQRLWFLEELFPGQGTYTLAAAIRLSGALDYEALRRSLEEIIRRHEVLRTGLERLDGVLAQVIAPAVPFQLPVADLREIPVSGRQAAREEAAREMAATGFDLGRAPLLRARLLDWGDDDRVLLVAAHHVVVDDWSMGVFARELGCLYEAFSQGQPSPLPSLPVQYADFAGWQRRQLNGPCLEDQVDYWRGQLAGLPGLRLPADRAPAAAGVRRGGSVPLRLPAPLVAGLGTLAGDQGATLFMVLLAGFWALLGRYSGQEDFGVGTPIAGRVRPELEGLIGFFANTLVLRADLSGNPTFEELLTRARETCLGAYAHQELPFERLVEELRPDRDLSRPPLFQAMLTLQNTPPWRLRLGEIQLDFEELPTEISRFDLELSFRAQDAGDLAGNLIYNADVFGRGVVEWLAGAFVRVLEEGLAGPGRRVSDLELLDAGVRGRLLGEWGRGPATPLGGGCLHRLVEEQADRSPGAVAVVCGERQLSYAELDRRASRLAHFLRRQGVGPEVRVGVCLGRSAELVVALLAVLKAGGAYVPLDPGYPAGRLEFMLADSGARVLVTEGGAGERLAGFGGCVVRLDAQAETIAAGPAGRPGVAVDPANLAYVIYTSGSTGRPKGVMITHGSAAAFTGWARETFGPDELARVLASTSVCFDLSVFEVFAPLSAGGAAVIAGTVLDLADHDAGACTLVNTVPSAMAEVVRLGAGLPAARVVNLAGEALPRRLVRQITDAPGFSRPRVVNLYGPTEDTTYSTMAVADPGDDAPPPIGRPVGHTEAYLLDAQLRPVPPGAAGELYLGGRGLARGYLGQPGLTAGRFVPSPFGPAGTRLYRTGDLCRFRADGQLAYLGRRDHQVKVRGYRVEPEETEAVLREHPGIAEAAVTARGQALAGYAVPRDGTRPDPAAVLAFLRTRLPAHMIPATLTILDAIPRTPNGKTDRTALPPPTPTPPTKQPAPRTHAEEVIAAIFAGKLGLPDVGVHDDFFELGGHSLLATEVVAEVREATGARLPLRIFFQAPTVAGLAEAMEHASAGAPGAGEADLAALIGEIEGLSDEQVQAELDRLESATERTRRET